MMLQYAGVCRVKCLATSEKWYVAIWQIKGRRRLSRRRFRRAWEAQAWGKRLARRCQQHQPVELA